MSRLLFVLIFITILSCKKEPPKPIENRGYILGKVVSIYDGDTYGLLTSNNQTIKVRMNGIDAPEIEMPFHEVSRQYLSKLIFKKNVYLDKTGEDIYGRTLGFTYLEDETDVNLEMLKAGMAWHFKRYNDFIEYADAEDDARENKIGLWEEDDPTPPWSFRRNNRN